MVIPGVEETRLDIDPAHNPDIVATITELGDIGPFDGIWCSHTLEHLYPHEVPRALSEFYRVLKPGGFVAVMVPDLADVRPTEEVIYSTAGGPITGLDLIYGLRSCIPDCIHMAHHTGFTASTMKAALDAAGFSKTVANNLPVFNLLGAGIKA